MKERKLQLTTQFVLSVAAVIFLGPASMTTTAATIEAREPNTSVAPETLHCGSQPYVKDDV